ncbi:hypothetical protein J3R83DRAFT_14055 [Lanmaoa asiatica]|nr:hypothetical protein J3R83DRAFT_14055 [Lanmaoa asiatica]
MTLTCAEYDYITSSSSRWVGNKRAKPFDFTCHHEREHEHVPGSRSSEFDCSSSVHRAEPALAERQSLPPVSVRVMLASILLFSLTTRICFSRRKMKCDSARPVCTPCLRGERAVDCEYTDGQRRPRTLTLEEDVARLRARVQELENPQAAIPSVQLYAPYAGASASASSSTTQPLGGATEPRQMDIEPDVQLYARRALSVIAPYAAELGFFLNPDRLRVQGAHVLPALQSALTLWSVDITSMSESDAQARARTQTLAPSLLSQTQTQFASALRAVDAEPDPAILLHVIQTGVLVAYYMQRIGEVTGARYYASGTWALVMMLRLYRRPNLPAGVREGEGQVPRVGGAQERLAPENTNTEANALAFAGCARVAAALDGIEAEERLRAFWAVYALDRWFSVVCGCEVPSQSLAMDGSAGNLMTVPWPGVGVTQARSNAVQLFLNDRGHDFTQQGASAMHAKASVLLGEARGIATSFAANRAISQSPTFRTHFGTLDVLLQRCLSAAMTMATALHGRQSYTQEQAHALVTVHIIALAQVTLHQPFISTYGPSRQRCVEGALSVVRVLDQLGEVRVGSISPIYAIVWTALCLVLHDEILRLRARPDADHPSRRREEGEIMAAIRKLVGVLSALSQRCPSRFFATNIEAVLSVLPSIAG